MSDTGLAGHAGASSDQSPDTRLTILSSDSSWQDFAAASDNVLREYWSTCPPLCEYGGHVRRLTNTIVAEASFEIHRPEFDNQLFAWQNIRMDGLVIPQPYCYRTFHDGLFFNSCILMQYIGGVRLDLLPNLTQEIERQVALTIHSIFTLSLAFHITKPGSVGSTKHDEFPFGDHELGVELQTYEQMLQCYNRRVKQHGPLDFNPVGELGLCHLDPANHNLHLLADGALAVFDWAAAGFFPRAVGVAAMRQVVFGRGQSTACICEELQRLSGQPAGVVDLVLRAYARGCRFAIRDG